MLDSSVPARIRSRAARVEYADLARWTGFCGLGLVLTWFAVRLHKTRDTAAAPFIGSYDVTVGAATLLAPLVALTVAIAVAQGAHVRMPWRTLLLASYVAAACWTLALAWVHGTQGLAEPLQAPDEYLVDVAAVGNDPAAFMDHFVENAAQFTPATRQHPPLPVLTLWLFDRAGISDPAVLGALLTLLATATVPLVAVAMRSLAGERAARELMPVLVLAPFALWVAVSMDAVVAAVAAAMITAGVLASEQQRGWRWRVAWSATCGVLLGAAALFSYSVVWLGVSVICVYFVRRQPLLNIVTGVCALLPLTAAQIAGFGWVDGLSAAQDDLSHRLGPVRPALWWGVLGIVVLLVACGPAVVASARKVRRTPAWPFLVGAAMGVGFEVISGLARGEAERSWLPFFPWLLVAAVAPERAGGEPTRSPLLLTAVGALAAIVLQAVLRSAW